MVAITAAHGRRSQPADAFRTGTYIGEYAEKISSLYVGRQEIGCPTLEQALYRAWNVRRLLASLPHPLGVMPPHKKHFFFVPTGSPLVRDVFVWYRYVFERMERLKYGMDAGCKRLNDRLQPVMYHIITID